MNRRAFLGTGLAAFAAGLPMAPAIAKEKDPLGAMDLRTVQDAIGCFRRFPADKWDCYACKPYGFERLYVGWIFVPNPLIVHPACPEYNPMMKISDLLESAGKHSPAFGQAMAETLARDDTESLKAFLRGQAEGRNEPNYHTPRERWTMRLVALNVFWRNPDIDGRVSEVSADMKSYRLSLR